MCRGRGKEGRHPVGSGKSNTVIQHFFQIHISYSIFRSQKAWCREPGLLPDPHPKRYFFVPYIAVRDDQRSLWITYVTIFAYIFASIWPGFFGRIFPTCGWRVAWPAPAPSPPPVAPVSPSPTLRNRGALTYIFRIRV
jgi:hypothetical protein